MIVFLIVFNLFFDFCVFIHSLFLLKKHFLERNEVFEHEEAIILFLYIEEFQDIIFQEEQHSLFKLLNKIYNKIDDLRQHYKIEKLEVINNFIYFSTYF